MQYIHKFPMACLKIDARRSFLQNLFLRFIFGLILGSVVTHLALKNTGQYLTLNSNAHLNLFLRAKSTPVITFNDNSKNQATEEIQRSDIAPTIVGEDVLSNWMWSRIRILCWIMTSPESLQEKAAHVKATWARRCNIVLFMSSENTDFPTIAVSDHEGREYLWEKTSGAFDYIYKNYIDKADWFLKADDDTYVIVENLRKLVSLYDTDKPIYFGRKYKFPHNPKVIYMQGGAGYVLSRKAVKVLVEEIFKSTQYANLAARHPSEDIMISTLLRRAKVEEGYSRDGIHEKFHAVAPEETIVPITHELTSYSFFPVKQGPECCSNYTISFHHVTNDTIHWLEYMVYHLQPFGIGYYRCPSNIRTIMGFPEVVSLESVTQQVSTAFGKQEMKKSLKKRKNRRKERLQKKKKSKKT